VAIDHFIGYGKLTPGGGLSNLLGALKKIVAGMPGLKAFKAVILDGASPENAMAANGLTGSEWMLLATLVHAGNG
jgi:hypothetical protein